MCNGNAAAAVPKSGKTPMSEPLGFVVLAKRPNQPDEIISAVFPAYPNGLEQAQNVLESRQKKALTSSCTPSGCQCDCHKDIPGMHVSHVVACCSGAVDGWVQTELDPVEYSIGEIRETR